MLRWLLFIMVIILPIKSYSQKNYKDVIAKAVKNYNYKKIESLAKSIGYKKGYIIKITFAFDKLKDKSKKTYSKLQWKNSIYQPELMIVF